MKQNKKSSQKNRVLRNRITHPKLIVFLLLLVALFPLVRGYGMYKNWDNAQMITGLAQDFPALVQDIEQATGLDLDIKSDCHQTQEKFSGGVRSCELRAAAGVADQNTIDRAVKRTQENVRFQEVKYNIGSKAYRLSYRGKEACVLSGSKTVYISCLTGVREANAELVIEEFSRVAETY